MYSFEHVLGISLKTKTLTKMIIIIPELIVVCVKKFTANTKSRIEQSLGSVKHLNNSCKIRRHLPFLTIFSSLLADGKSVSLCCISC